MCNKFFTRDSKIWFFSCCSSSNKKEEKLKDKKKNCIRQLFVDCLPTILILVDNLTIVEFLHIYYFWLLSFLFFSITKISKRLLCTYIYIFISIQKKRTSIKTKKTIIIDNKNNNNTIDIDIFIILSITFFKKDRTCKVSTIDNINIDKFVNKSKKNKKKLKQLSLQTILLKLYYIRIFYLQLKSTNYVSIFLLQKTRL